jgi:hypothetical protein
LTFAFRGTRPKSTARHIAEDPTNARNVMPSAPRIEATPAPAKAANASPRKRRARAGGTSGRPSAVDHTVIPIE